MKRLLPHPLLSSALWFGWLALNNSIAPAHILLGAMLAWVLPLTGLHLTDGTWPRLRSHRFLVALRLGLRILVDIVVSRPVNQTAIFMCDLQLDFVWDPGSELSSRSVFSFLFPSVSSVQQTPRLC